MKKAIIISAIAFLAVAGYFCFVGGRENYDRPLNVIGKIKYVEPVHKKDAYRPIVLTPVAYSRRLFLQTVTAKATYRGEPIGLKIIYRRLSDKVELHSIGAESDRFAWVLAELYEEPGSVARAETESQPPAEKMRRRIPTRMGNDGTVWIDWRREAVSYKLVAPGLNGREAEILLTIDIPGGTLSLGDRLGGLAKKRFTDAFRGEINE